MKIKIPLYRKVSKNPTPVMLVDPQIAVKNARVLIKLLKDVEVFYAVKSLIDAEIVKALKPVVHGFDVASLGEVRELIKLGVKPGKMLFSNPVKIPDHI